MQDLWTLKYRAGTLEEMLGNEHAVDHAFRTGRVRDPAPPHFVRS